MADAEADLPPRDMVTDGGQSPTERRATFTELSLCLAAGLPDEGLETLLKVCQSCGRQGRRRAQWSKRPCFGELRRASVIRHGQMLTRATHGI